MSFWLTPDEEDFAHGWATPPVFPDPVPVVIEIIYPKPKAELTEEEKARIWDLIIQASR